MKNKNAKINEQKAAQFVYFTKFVFFPPKKCLHCHFRINLSISNKLTRCVIIIQSESDAIKVFATRLRAIIIRKNGLRLSFLFSTRFFFTLLIIIIITCCIKEMMLVAFFTVVSNINALEFQETTDQIEEGLESCTDPGIARIAGGEPANHSSWPWLVRLAIHDSRFGTLTCGGTIVSNKYVLTAGHCLFFATKVVATFADGSIAENEDAEFSLESTTFHIHPDYVGLNRGVIDRLNL